MANQKRKSDCPINYALELFGDRWTFLIIRDLMFKGKHSYGAFLQSEEKIATNILADRLSLLEQAEVVIKYPDPAHGSKYIYKLSQKGIDLVPILAEIIMWSAKYDVGSVVEKEFVKIFKKNRETVLKDISSRLKKDLAA